MPTKLDSSVSTLAAYLRSIDVELDAQEPERIRHFMPTEKSVRLVEHMLAEHEDRAAIVIAPYGSGKSLAASYGLHLIENREASRQTLKVIEGRLREVAPALADKTASRRKLGTDRGLVVALSGPVPELHEELCRKTIAAFRRFKLGRQARALQDPPESPEQLPQYLDVLQEKAAELGFDRIVIIWDEFGKHLEYLVQDGRVNHLFHVQKLAEYVARASLPMSFSAILHMGLLHYASTLSQSARAEWRKVEGRFATIDYVDDSKHLYSLIARLVRNRRTSLPDSDTDFECWIQICREHQLFRDFSDTELAALVESAFPFTPAALYLLPRLTGRIAQNERTLFHFLSSWDGENHVGPAELFDYFAPQLKADISTGGTHRVWLEANSALQKVDGDETLESVLKTACLFGLGLEGRKGGAGLGLLRHAWRHYVDVRRVEPCPVRELIDRKLLLYRQYKDEVAVWHGSDLDLRGHLEAEKARRAPTFDLISFLNEQTPPPYLRPVSYNSKYCIRRFFSGEFRAVVADGECTKEVDVSVGDGHIVYWLPSSQEELEHARHLAAQNDKAMAVMVVPAEPLPLAEAALEVHCLYAMQKDADLVASDPLALDEISQLASDAEAHLHSLVQRCTSPARSGPSWYFEGRPYTVHSPEDLRELLSDICSKVYPKTPRLNNEMINKRSPSAVVVNSRKRLVLGILERYGIPDLGLVPTTPDGSMFRSLLVATGLYADHGATGWRFSTPEDKVITDPSLAEAWHVIADFFTQCEGKRPVAELKSQLMHPPYGIREGTFPILLAAGIRAFGGMAAFRRDGVLLDDMLPTTIEDMAARPDAYSVEAVRLTRISKSIIRAMLKSIGVELSKPDGAELLRLAGEHVAEWRAGLPPHARTRVFHSAGLNEFRDALFLSRDHVQLFTHALPQWMNAERVKPRELSVKLSSYVDDLQNADRVFYGKIETALRQELGLGHEGDIEDVLFHHASMFNRNFLDQMPDKLAAQFLRRMRIPYDDRERLCRSIAQLLTETQIRNFGDKTMDTFLARLKEVSQAIDSAASTVEVSDFGEGLRAWLVSNRCRRIQELYDDLVRLEGPSEAEMFVRNLVQKLEGKAS
jgi:hypothetical protein